MNIVFISAAFYPSIGGVETHALAVANELVRRGHQVTVITEDKSHSKHSKYKSDNKAGILKKFDKSTYFTHKKLDQIDIYYFKYNQTRFFKTLDVWWKLIRNYKLFIQADIIHCHDVFIWALPFRFIFPTKKIYTTFHGYEGVFPPEKKAVWIRRITEYLSRGNICVGDFIQRWYGTNPNYVIYGGVDETLNQKVVSWKKPKKKIKLLLVGRLDKDIGIRIYKTALKKLDEMKVQYELIVCGDGSMRGEIEPYGKVLGFVKNPKAYIKKADIIFASSYLLMLQALQYGKPVFAVSPNPLKHDYLYSSPFAKFIYIFEDGGELAKGVRNYKFKPRKIKLGMDFANSQTWSHVADIYEKLWMEK